MHGKMVATLHMQCKMTHSYLNYYYLLVSNFNRLVIETRVNVLEFSIFANNN